MGLGLALGTSTQLTAASSNKLSKAGFTKKRLLILGGTGFIGPPMVRYALERGHEVTIFTRGKSKTRIPGVEHLIGDRTGDPTDRFTYWPVRIEKGGEVLAPGDGCDHASGKIYLGTHTVPAEQQAELRIGIKPEREKMVLQAWHEHIPG